MVAIFIPGLFRFEQSFDARMWFRTTDPLIQTLDEFEFKFGNDESIVIAYFNEDGIYSKDALEKIQFITDQAWQVSQVIRVESLTNHIITTGSDDNINSEPIFDEDIEWDQSYLAERAELARSSRRIPGFLVSDNEKMSLIYARLVPSVVEDPIYHQVYREANDRLSQLELGQGEKILFSGEATISNAFREIALRDIAIIIPLLMLLIVVYNFLIFRSVIISVIPLLITVASVIMSLGLGFYFGVKFSNILSLLPIVLVAISVADSVHIISYYFDHRARGDDDLTASRAALDKNFLPTFLTSFSTAIGFLSLTTTELTPIKELGFLAAFGVMAVWFLTYFFMAGLLNLMHFKLPSFYARKVEYASSVSVRCAYWINQHKRKIIAFFSVATVLSLYLASMNIVSADPYSYFKKGTIYRQSNDFIEKHFGGVSGPEILIRAHSEGGIQELDFLNRVEQLDQWIDQHDFVGSTVSLLDILKEVNQTMNNDEESFYRLPEDRQAVAQFILLYSMGLPLGSDLNNLMSLNMDTMRVSVLWDITDSITWKREVDAIKLKALELGLDIEITGKLNLYQRMIDYVVETFLRSITVGIVLISLILTLFFKSIKIGLLSMLPNLLSLIFGGAFMFLMGFELNIGTALVASVCLGIAVDDTIHFFTRYYQSRKDGEGPYQSVVKVYQTTGKALVITSLILVSGFALYLFGSFVPNIYFGVLCAFTLTMALLVDLIFLPAVLMLSSKDNSHV
jgi:uncharacterized protein